MHSGYLSAVVDRTHAGMPPDSGGAGAGVPLGAGISTGAITGAGAAGSPAIMRTFIKCSRQSAEKAALEADDAEQIAMKGNSRVRAVLGSSVKREFFRAKEIWSCGSPCIVRCSHQGPEQRLLS